MFRNVPTGNLVAGLLMPCSPTPFDMVLEETTEPKSEARGVTAVLPDGLMDFQASVAANWTARWFTDGSPVCARSSAIEGEFALMVPMITLATLLTLVWKCWAWTIPIKMGKECFHCPVADLAQKECPNHLRFLGARWKVNLEMPCNSNQKCHCREERVEMSV